MHGGKLSRVIKMFCTGQKNFIASSLRRTRLRHTNGQLLPAAGLVRRGRNHFVEDLVLFYNFCGLQMCLPLCDGFFVKFNYFF